LYVESLGISETQQDDVIRLAAAAQGPIDPAVLLLIAATNGLTYRHLIGILRQYPIPDLRLPPGEGRILLDIGCSWGRWSLAATRLGYRTIGIDPSLGAVMAARRIARQLGLDMRHVVGDARYLPFANQTIDVAFSYSVLQHFSRDDVGAALAEAGRVLRPGGTSLMQMPTRWGLRCLYHQARRRFREAAGFEVRYWTIDTLQRLFTTHIGPSTASVDCFFGLGLQRADRHLMPPKYRIAISASEALRAASRFLRPLSYVADSVYVASVKTLNTEQP
jgi:SAM-dependent methyltransferase